MKKIIYIITMSLLIFSCEDVIDLEVPTSEPKLVIDASINWFKGSSGNEQEIKLTLTAPYFDNEVPPATGAQIVIEDTNNNTFQFVEDGNTGIYKNSTFVPTINGNYNLTINYQGEIFTATETLKPVSEIEYAEQNNDGGFSGEDTEVKVYFTDPGDEENYYFFEYIASVENKSTLDTLKDEFINGNQIFGFYVNEDFEPGETLTARHFGVSARFYEYMFILLQQNSENGGGPFETQPATVRGNCINQTNPDNFPLGYFRLSEADEFIYTIE